MHTCLTRRLVTPALVLSAVMALAGCGQDSLDSLNYPELHLGDQRQIALTPSSEGYSYTFKIPPQGATRYDATLTLVPIESGHKFRARLATTCSQETEQPDEVSSAEFSTGDVVFRWSAESSTQFAQIASDEEQPFDLKVTLEGALR